jgi:hypothetical protein
MTAMGNSRLFWFATPLPLLLMRAPAKHTDHCQVQAESPKKAASSHSRQTRQTTDVGDDATAREGCQCMSSTFKYTKSLISLILVCRILSWSDHGTCPSRVVLLQGQHWTWCGCQNTVLRQLSNVWVVTHHFKSSILLVVVSYLCCHIMTLHTTANHRWACSWVGTNKLGHQLLTAWATSLQRNMCCNMLHYEAQGSMHSMHGKRLHGQSGTFE